MEMDKLDILKLSTTALVGTFAGGAIYINVVDIPALRKVTDDSSARRFWKEAFLRAAKWQGGLGGVAAITSGIVYCLDDSSTRNLWLIGSGMIASTFPWTLFVMLPDIKRMLDDNVLREEGGDWVRTKIETWNKRHMYRTVVGLSVLGLFLYAVRK